MHFGGDEEEQQQPQQPQLQQQQAYELKTDAERVPSFHRGFSSQLTMMFRHHLQTPPPVDW